MVYYTVVRKPVIGGLPNTYYMQVNFTEEGKKLIWDEFNRLGGNNPRITVSSTTIRDNLFPELNPDEKDNASHNIQVVLGRDYGGR